MIDSLQVKNFRCFRDLSLDGFGTVNVIVGDNASGKTALLESIFLVQAGTPEIVLRMRTWRSLGSSLAAPSTRAAYEAIWKDLFFQFRQDRPIEISTRGTPESTWSLKIFYDPSESSAIPLSTTDNVSGTINVQKSDLSWTLPITFEHTDTNKKQAFKPVFSFPQGLVLGGGTPNVVPCAFFSSSFAAVVMPSEIANQFSELDKKNKTRPVLKAIKRLYPRIMSLSVQTESGTPLLFCEPKGLSEKVPIAVESAGTHKLTAILLGIATQPNGIVMIDEIENGFYYQKFSGVWQALLDFCNQFNVQVFASTHSRECLEAIQPVLKKHEEEFRLIRAERKDRDRLVKLFRGDEFEAAVKTGIEFR